MHVSLNTLFGFLISLSESCVFPSNALTQCFEIMCTQKKNFQEGVPITFAEMSESSKGQEEHSKQRPMTFVRYSYPVLLLQLPWKGPICDYLRQKGSHPLR